MLLVCVCVCAAGFFRSSNNVIHAAEGPIYAIAWCGSLIAWANDIGTHRIQWQARTCDAPHSRDSLRLTHAPAGVKIYDVNTEQRITFIDRPKGSPKADLYRCSLCWEDPHTLLIGWADMVRIAVIKARCPLFHCSFFPFWWRRRQQPYDRGADLRTHHRNEWSTPCPQQHPRATSKLLKSTPHLKSLAPRSVSVLLMWSTYT